MHEVITDLYGKLHAPPTAPLSRREAATALTDAFLTINWHPDKEQFTNMRCIDASKKHLTAWRTLAEIGWTGGGVIGYPLLAAGLLLENEEAGERARYLYGLLTGARNGKSGLFWDVCGRQEGKALNWWWSGYLVRDVHCAYTNGSACYYALKGADFARRHMGSNLPGVVEAVCAVLKSVCKLQQTEGNFGYTYSAERPEMLDPDGFVGVYFAAALALAHRLTGDKSFLDPARRAMEFYRRPVRELNCWGTPMDTWKSPDQEGNLGFLRAARLLHEETGEDVYLDMLAEGAGYEYLWRYGYRARPEYPPLKGSPWSSCGGSVTSVSNPHIHPMGVSVSGELAYLARRLDSDYHRKRCRDGVDWGVNCVGLYPEHAGYGAPGVLTERWCPSDGLAIETFPDGTPSSMWFSYNGWAAASVLEGLCDVMLSG